jgi:hypothetical protein
LVFFSRAGDNYFNGGRKDLTVGNTEVVGGMVRNALRCDVFQIEALDPRRGSERSRFLREDPGDPIYADVAPFRFALGDHLDPAIRDHLKTGHSQIRVIWVEPRSSCRCTCCHRVRRRRPGQASFARRWRDPGHLLRPGGLLPISQPGGSLAALVTRPGI